jgi:Legume lectin domain/PEP-CTERM motif
LLSYPSPYAVPAQALLVTYPNFSSTAGLTLVGNTTTAVTGDGTVLRLTGAAGGEAGAAYSTSAITLGPSDTFSTQFRFRITDPGGIDPADGFTFVLAASPTGLGAAGGALGYGGVANSVAIEFDTYNNGADDGNSSNHVAINENGHINDGTSMSDQNLTNVYGNPTCDFSAGSPNTAPGCLSNGDLWTALITYNGTDLNVTLTDPAESGAFDALVSVPINIASILGTSAAYVGFTAGTGEGFENHDIISWEFSNTAVPPTPEPATLSLLGAGLAAMGIGSRWRKKRG